MSTKVELLTPVGRLVQGSLYSGATTDAENRPLVYKTGQNAGQPRVNYWFNVAIPKAAEQHWNQTEWGQKVWNVGQAGFPQGQANSPHFAWKIIDGDSVIPNTQGNKPCDSEGFPGNWVLRFSGSYAPSLYNENGTLALTEPNAIQLGDYVQVYGYVEDNKSTQQPGVYLNHSMVARSAFGTRIVTGADPKSVGFGGAALPAGASKTPLASFAPPAVPAAIAPPAVPAAIAPVAVPAAIAPVAVPAPVPPAYPQILTPAAPSTPVTTAKANGATYEQLISAGWTHETMLQHGMITA